jgi:tetratricopeptide (TPR) repeat protein
MRKRLVALATLLAFVLIAGVVVYQAAARERDYRFQLSRGDAARRDDQAFAAIEAYSAAIGLRPDSMLAHLRRGEVYRRRGELDAAARDFRLAAALDPSAPRPLEELGDTLFARQRYGAAAQAYERRLALDDRSAAVAYKLSLARFRDGNIDLALASTAQAIRANPRLAEAHYLQGLCFRDKRRVSEAAAAFERAAALSPTLLAAREELADLYRESGRHAEELEQLQLLATLDRDHIERQIAVARAHASAGRIELAVLALGAAVARATSEGDLKVLPDLYATLGDIWLDTVSERSDALSKALEALGRAAAYASASSDVMTRYGKALIAAGQLESAEQVLKRATERYPIAPAAFQEYASIANRLGHSASATEAAATQAALFPAASSLTPGR